MVAEVTVEAEAEVAEEEVLEAVTVVEAEMAVEAVMVETTVVKVVIAEVEEAKELQEEDATNHISLHVKGQTLYM